MARLTVQREDIEPEENRARAAPDWRADRNFTWPERIPWSQLGPDFIDMWGFDPPRGKREHLEVVGPSGSGKTHFTETVLQDHYREASRRRDERKGKNIETGAVFVATKTDDDIFRELGWPVAHNVGEIRDTNLIFWPRTGKKGMERDAYMAHHVDDLLSHLFTPHANTVVAFDEVGYAESLSANIRKLIQQFWREGRALGIQVIGMKQRPQGALRDMHSETFWTVAFKPNDRSDLERFAELFGHRRDWMPVFDDLDQDKHEFIIRHSRSRESYISWIDTPLVPQKIQRKGLRSIVSR